MSLLNNYAWARALISLLPRRLHVGGDIGPRDAAVTLVLLHGLGCTHGVWDPLIDRLPGQVRVVSLDLLGFGRSPKPAAAHYSNHTQARSIGYTLKRLGVGGRVIVAGHSLGSLSALAFAADYPGRVNRVVACGAPLYHPNDDADVLKQLYEMTAHNFEQNKAAVVAAAGFLQKTGLAPRGLDLNHRTIQPYIDSLRAAIINQSIYDDVARLAVPALFLCGRFDPLVRSRTIGRLQQQNNHLTLKRLLASHELSDGYLRRVAQVVEMVLER